MTITNDTKRNDSVFIDREYVDTTGEVFATATLAPSVLPMTGFDCDQLEVAIWLTPVRNSKGLKRGELYRLKHIHNDGRVVIVKPALPYRTDWWWQESERTVANATERLLDVPGLWPMELFALYVPNSVALGAPKTPKGKQLDKPAKE